MERAALYRRALAPIMIAVGCIGLAAAILGWTLAIAAPRAFILYWLGVAAIACAVAFLLVRRQAIRAGEPVWSPPARRVVQAATPPLAAGGLLGLAFLAIPADTAITASGSPAVGLVWLPPSWIVLYGCAMHAAGFFMPRGMRPFGWLLICGGCTVFTLKIADAADPRFAHATMGAFFGVVHQAYGFYLYLTEKKDCGE
ncbi:MAG TPA: hypothetical protein VNO52_03675 [Methylomirabilota bacterium]|nr:hypothetical protein [Methylomirabilota bacterium]